MARADSRTKLNRRKFLAGVAIAGAAAPQAPHAATVAEAPVVPPRRSALRPTARIAAAETATPAAAMQAEGTPASDFMVDVIKSLDIAYLPCNPAQSFRGLHESLINYGGNKKPEFLTCTHEEASVAMAHGYFKIAGKPLLVLCHGTVGLQHAAMAIYNAWCDRVPVIVMGGNRPRCRQASARRADLPFGAGHQRAGARIHQMGRPTGVAAALRAIVRARLQAGDDAAARAGDARARLRSAGRGRARPRQANDPALRADRAAAR
jgi:hypothetical protein